MLGANAFGFVALRVASWLPARSRLASAIVLTGLIGLAGNVAYGFEAIHMSFGDVQLVDRSGAANLIKPLGMFFPFSFVLAACGLAALSHRAHAIVGARQLQVERFCSCGAGCPLAQGAASVFRAWR